MVCDTIYVNVNKGDEIVAYINKRLREAMESLECEGEDGDVSWWLYYKPGWVDALSGCHAVHETTKADTIRMAHPVPCKTYGCCQEIA